MSRRQLEIAWIVLVALCLVALIGEGAWWKSLRLRGARAGSEQLRLGEEIRAKNEEMAREMRTHSEVLGGMLWSAGGGDPSSFLTRLGELAQGARLRTTAIGPLEQQSAPQFTRSWHTVQVIGPYQELKDLAARIERERGFLEGVRLEGSKHNARPGAAESQEVEARFNITTIELKPEAKAVLQRVLAATRAAPATPAKPEPFLALPLPSRPGEPAQAVRDPFAFVAAAPSSPPARVAAGPRSPTPGPGGLQPATPAAPLVRGEPPKPLPPMEVKGIMSFPGGYLAIVNNQIVRLGDLVDGHRVERITDTEVVLRQPSGSPRSITLPGIGAVAPAAPRR